MLHTLSYKNINAKEILTEKLFHFAITANQRIVTDDNMKQSTHLILKIYSKPFKHYDNSTK